MNAEVHMIFSEMLEAVRRDPDAVVIPAARNFLRWSCRMPAI